MLEPANPELAAIWSAIRTFQIEGRGLLGDMIQSGNDKINLCCLIWKATRPLPSDDAVSGASRKAAWAECRHDACGHRWVIAYLPMEIMKAANAMQRATCPMCGDTRPYAFAPPSGGSVDDRPLKAAAVDGRETGSDDNQTAPMTEGGE